MAQAIDPVCKMTVDAETARYKSEYEGKTYYFCGSGCKVAFDRNPGKYLDQEQSGQGGHTDHSQHGH